jgi:hypothetical protein
MSLNRRKIWQGGAAGGFLWIVWSLIVHMFVIGSGRYEAVQSAGLFLKEPRYRAFEVQWFLMLFILAILLAHLYVWVRPTLGPGPKTALKVGALVGFASGFPTNFGTATWAVIPRIFPLGWMLELWVGSILATLVAGWIYKESNA